MAEYQLNIFKQFGVNELKIEDIYINDEGGVMVKIIHSDSGEVIDYPDNLYWAKKHLDTDDRSKMFLSSNIVDGYSEIKSVDESLEKDYLKDYLQVGDIVYKIASFIRESE